jgi:beta-phosphoglucomutase-like phosphatase (HAD superfamily)
MRLWFANLITYSEALTLAGVYVPFTDIGAAVLRMLAATRGRFSVDETVRRHKPAPEAYGSVCAELGVDPSPICLIACHVWDTLGAIATGWRAGLILREGNAPLDIGPQPNYVGDDLDAIADQLIARYPA